ncbi:tRNA pseudouridine(55) synthase TruB [Candidatus Poribacteria bacterium]|nr:tRNA pseudouridine(55) synthase TruB [Candidatus Poribacteria bacterium]
MRPQTNSGPAGIIVVDKPAGISSQQVVTRVKRAMRYKKAGHAGTLDPEATGVLVVCLAEATRLFEALQAHEKEYVSVVRLGVETNTFDMTGEVVAECEVPPLSAEDVERVLDSYRGDIQQIPPMFSALKHRGQPLYKLARQGITVERPPRAVTVREMELVELSPPEMTLRTVCSRGTYIRTLAHDIGRDLGCGGCIQTLARTRSGPFSVDRAMTLDDIEADPAQAIEAVSSIDAVRAMLAAEAAEASR